MYYPYIKLKSRTFAHLFQNRSFSTEKIWDGSVRESADNFF